MANAKGRVTIPTDMDVVKETLEIMEEWGADAIRDCDGTEFPQELRDTGAKVYATYYTTRKDNEWAKSNPDEIQQMYIVTKFHTAVEDTLSIHLMDHLYPDMLKVNNRDDITRWWEVIDRTTGEVVPTDSWSYDEESGNVTIHGAKLFHEYTVSFLAYIMWDRYICTTLLLTNGMLNLRLLLMFASQKQEHIRLKGFANSLTLTNMLML